MNTEIEELKNKILELEKERLNLRAKLSRALNPENPNYTDEELEAMEYFAKNRTYE